MKSLAFATAIGFLLAIGTGCSSSNNNNPGTSAGGSSSGGGSSTGGAGGGAPLQVVTCPSFTKDSDNNSLLNATAASNYTFWSEVKLGDTQIVKSKTDVTVDWSGLTKDMFGASMDPKADIGNLAMVFFHMTKDQLQTKINEDSLLPADRVNGAITYLTGGTKTQASTKDFDVLGQPLNHDVLMGNFDDSAYPPAEYTYLVMLGSGAGYGKNGRAIGVFGFSPSASTSTVNIGPNSTSADFRATLDQLKPIAVPMNTNKLSFDWGALNKNAAGRDQDPVATDRVMVAEFTQSIAELQTKENFLNLEKLAMNTWSTTDLAGTTVDLSTLLSDKDQSSAFPGIDSSHTWLLVLQNALSQNPAPWYLTALQPCK